MMSQSEDPPRLPLEILELDQQIWQEELSGIIPEKLFDIHVHVYQPGHISRNSPELQAQMFSSIP